MNLPQIIGCVTLSLVCHSVMAQKTNDEAKDNQKVEDQKVIDAFFAELEGLLESPDQTKRAVNELRKELKKEYRANETKLLEFLDANVLVNEEPESISNLRTRQQVIVLYDIELAKRLGNDRTSPVHNLPQKVHTRFQEFRQANPRLGREPRVQQKRNEIMQAVAAKQQKFFGRGVRGENLTLAGAKKKLSALGNNPVPAPNPQATLTDSLAHPHAKSGPMQKKRAALKALLKLKWAGEMLTLDRNHWNAPFAEKTPIEVTAEVDRLLEKEGVSQERDPNVRRRSGLHASSNVETLFNELRDSTNHSYSRGGSDGMVKASFSQSDLEGSLILQPDRFEFVLRELTGPSRCMRIVQTKDSIDISVLGDLVHRFHCNKDGVTVVELSDDETLRFKADSFSQLYKDEPKFVEMRLFAIFDHIGITLPATRFSPVVVDRLVEVIDQNQSQLSKEVEQLIADLDSDLFTTREAAYKKLSQNIGRYYDLLYPKKDDRTISVEVLARVRKLLTIRSIVEVSHRDAVVAALDLDNNVAYLEELLTVIDEANKPVIAQQLEKLKAAGKE